MIKSLLINFLIICFIMTAYYFSMFDFLTSNVFLGILFVIIAIIFAVGIKVLGNPFAASSTKKETDKKE